MTISNAELNTLAATTDMGRAERVHFQTLVNNIVANTSPTTVDTTLLTKAMRSLIMSGRYSSYYAYLLSSAITTRAADHTASIGSADVIAATRIAIQYLRHCGLKKATVVAIEAGLVD